MMQGIIVLLLMISTLLLIVTIVPAPPTLPHHFYGSAKDASGANLSDGVRINLTIIDAHDGTKTFFYTPVINGFYNLSNVTSEGGDAGDKVYFFVQHGNTYVNTTQSSAYAPGGETQVNLVDDVPISSVNAISTYWHKTSPLHLNVTAVDQGANGLKNVTLYYYYSTNNATFSGPTAFGINTTPWLGISWHFNFPSGNGYYRFYSRATDNASNYEVAPVANDTQCGYDTTAPTSSIAYNNTRSYFKAGEKLKIYANFTETLSGIKETTVTINISTMGDGDLSNLTMSKTNNTRWYYSWTIPSGTDENGAFTVKIYAQDNATNYLSPYPTTSVTKGIDNTKPNCAIAYNNTRTYFKAGEALKIYANFTETLSGMNEVVTINIATAGNGDLANTTMIKTDNTHYYYSWTIPSGSDDDGTFTVNVYAQDNATNYPDPYPTTSSTKKIDNTVPTCAIAYNRSATYFKAGTVLKIWANFSESGSGISESTVIINISTAGDGDLANTTMSRSNNTRWYKDWTIPSGTDEDGAFTVKIYARDNASNLLGTYPTTSATKKIDNTVPTCAIAYNRSATYFKAGTVLKIWANFTESGSGIDETTVTINISTAGNGDLYNTTMSRTNNTHWYKDWTIPSGSDDNGAFTVKIWGKDNVSINLASYPTTSATKSIDNTVPTSNITVLSDYWQNNTPLTIHGNASDALSGVYSVTLHYYNSSDNITWEGPWTFGTDTAAPWSWSFTFPNITSHYRFYSRATDNAGNIETAPIENDTCCFYNNTPPTTPHTPTPTNGSTTNTGERPASFSWKAGDPNTDTVNYTVYLRKGNSTFNSSYIIGYKISNEINVTYNLTTTLDWSSTYYWKIVATDEHGAVTAGPIWHFTTGAESSGPSPAGPGPGPGPSTGNKAPTADADGPYTGYVNATITFNASKSSDSDGTITGYKWDWTNDGTYDTDWLTSPTATHVYTQAGTYTVKLQVKDNGSATDDDTANVTIKPLPIIYASQEALDFLKAYFGLNFTTPFYATDTNGDGIVDTFIDPNYLFTFVRFANINGSASFLLSTGNDDIPEFFWDTDVNMSVLLTYVPLTVAETWIDTQAGEIILVTNVQKSGWAYLKMTDSYPPELYPNFTLTVKTTNNRVIPTHLIWREDGFIYVLDDPAVQYLFIYSYTALPPVINPPNGTIFAPTFTPPAGTIFNITRPTITMTYFEEVTLLLASLNNQNILTQITTTDHKTFVLTPSQKLAEGAYTLSLTVQDDEGNTLTSTAAYTITLEKKPTLEIPWLLILLVVIILVIIIVLVILRKLVII